MTTRVLAAGGTMRPMLASIYMTMAGTIWAGDGTTLGCGAVDSAGTIGAGEAALVGVGTTGVGEAMAPAGTIGAMATIGVGTIGLTGTDSPIQTEGVDITIEIR